MLQIIWNFGSKMQLLKSQTYGFEKGNVKKKEWYKIGMLRRKIERKIFIWENADILYNMFNSQE